MLRCTATVVSGRLLRSEISPLMGTSTRFVNIDHSEEKPAAVQLEHIQLRLSDTVPLMFRQRLDYTFYRKDVVCDDQILRIQRNGVDSLMRHFGLIGSLGQMLFPHIEMETVSVIPMVDDGTVRCRWRIKYVSFLRLITNPRLLRFDYRSNNLSWFDGYSVLTVDGNGDVYKITLQKTMEDEGGRFLATSPSEKLKEKMATLQRPAETTNPIRS